MGRLSLIEKKNWKVYHIPGMGNLNSVKLDAIFISTANSFEHEMEKFRVCWEIKKKGHKFITEAERSIKGVKYRRDVVDITTGEVYEIETSKERAKRFDVDPDRDNITVIKLWER